MASQVVSIPINKIKPNPDNPRKVVPPEAVDKCAASMKAAGQKTPIKVRPLTGGNYGLVGGHIRLLAAKKLGWKELNAIVMDIPAEQVLLDAILDNRDEEMTWLELYEAIEALMSRPPKKTQQEVADLLEVTQFTVSRAAKLLKALNKAAREAIYSNSIKPDSSIIAENAVFRLSDLGNETKIEKSLKVVLGRQMTEPQVRRLVAWVKEGHTPASYSSQKMEKSSNRAIDDPNYELWKILPSWVTVRRDKQTAYELKAVLDKFGAPYGVYCLLSGMRKFEQSVQAWENPEVKLPNPYEARLEELFEKGLRESRANWEKEQKDWALRHAQGGHEKKARKNEKQSAERIIGAASGKLKDTARGEPIESTSGNPKKAARPEALEGVSEKELKSLETLLDSSGVKEMLKDIFKKK